MSSTLSVWSQDKWRGQFTVKWIYVKDVPNAALRHIRLENNENKPVTNSRDTQEVPVDKGRQVRPFVLFYFQSICVTNCKIAGAQDPALVPTRHVHFRRFQPLRETTGGGRPAEDDRLVPWRRRQLRKRPDSSSSAAAARKRPRLVQAAAVGPSRRRIRARK